MEQGMQDGCLLPERSFASQNSEGDIAITTGVWNRVAEVWSNGSCFNREVIRPGSEFHFDRLREVRADSVDDCSWKVKQDGLAISIIGIERQLPITRHSQLLGNGVLELRIKPGGDLLLTCTRQCKDATFLFLAGPALLRLPVTAKPTAQM